MACRLIYSKRDHYQARLVPIILLGSTHRDQQWNDILQWQVMQVTFNCSLKNAQSWFDKKQTFWHCNHRLYLNHDVWLLCNIISKVENNRLKRVISEGTERRMTYSCYDIEDIKRLTFFITGKHLILARSYPRWGSASWWAGAWACFPRQSLFLWWLSWCWGFCILQLF